MTATNNHRSQSHLTLLTLSILALIAVVAFSSRLFSVIRFESVIHEFDPWFNYRTTKHLVTNGLYEFWNWFDESSWYPLGRVVGGTLYPGLMVTAATLHNILHYFNFPVDIRNVCVFFAPVFSGLTAVAAYLLTKELKDSSAGLLAAAFIGIAPGYISRSVAGSYDNEGIAIFLLVFTFYLWIKALKLGSASWAALAALFYFYMVSAWGGYVFITNLVPLHAFALILMGRYSKRLYVSYSTFYALGTLMSMQIPFVGFQPVKTSEHMAALGIFGLLQIIGFVEFLRTHLPSKQFQVLFKWLVVGIFFIMVLVFVGLSLAGVVAPFTGRFYSLWDTSYAKKYLPIIASVSEHQPTPWTSFFFDLQILVFLFPAGIYFCFKDLRDEHVFVILYAVTASYFAGVMVRLMLTLTPIVCVAAAIAASKVYDVYLAEAPEEETTRPTSSTSLELKKSKKMGKSEKNEKSANAGKGSSGGNKVTTRETEKEVKIRVSSLPARMVVRVVITFLLVMFALHCTWVTSNAYSSPSIVLASRNADGSQLIIDDFREAYYWLRKNTAEDARVLAWWDYGYQLAGMANRTTLVDNNTWNNTHIAMVGKAMASNERDAYDILRFHDVNYVLVIFGGVVGYSGDDINKFLWMIRIAEGMWPEEVKESSFFTERGEYRVDEGASKTMKESLLYKMSYYRFGELFKNTGRPAVDRVRNARIPDSPIKLSVLDEAYTTENWIVRIFKVKEPDNIGRDLAEVEAFESGKRMRKRRRPRKA